MNRRRFLRTASATTIGAFAGLVPRPAAAVVGQEAPGEPNDGPETATPIRIGGSRTSGRIDGGEDLDWYRFDVDRPSQLVVDPAVERSEHGLFVALFGPTPYTASGRVDELHRQLIETGASAGVGGIAYRPGTYYVVVASPTGAGGEYSFAVSASDLPPRPTFDLQHLESESDYDDWPGHVGRLERGVAQYGSFGHPNEAGVIDGEDWYSFGATAGETLRLAFHNQLLAEPVHVGIWGPNSRVTGGYVLLERAITYSGEFAFFEVKIREGGLHYVQLTPATSDEARSIISYEYNLALAEEWDDLLPVDRPVITRVAESEPNDEPSRALPIRSGTEVVGTLATETDTDWIRIEAEAGDTIWVNERLRAGSVNQEYYRPDLSSAGIGGERISVGESGPHYIRLFGTGTYAAHVYVTSG